MLKILVNGEARQYPVLSTITTIMDNGLINPQSVVVEHNNYLVARGEWDSVILNDGDTIEIVQLMGGGNYQ